MQFRDWRGSSQDIAALARLTSAQYPDSPVTPEGVARNLALSDPQRPFLVRFAVQDGQEVAFVECYPQGGGRFLLEICGDVPDNLKLALLRHAQTWGAMHGARTLEISIPADDGRRQWLTAQGATLLSESSEWTYTGLNESSRPIGVQFMEVGENPVRQEQLRQLINRGRAELEMPPFDPDGFKLNVLNCGVYQPDLLWLAYAPAGEPIGATTLHVWDAGKHAEALWLSVVPQWRRQGVASALLLQAAWAAQIAGIPLVTTNLTERHQHLAPLLHRAGFQRTGGWLTLSLPGGATGP